MISILLIDFFYLRHEADSEDHCSITALVFHTKLTAIREGTFIQLRLDVTNVHVPAAQSAVKPSCLSGYYDVSGNVSYQLASPRCHPRRNHLCKEHSTEFTKSHMYCLTKHNQELCYT